ncbi:MAG: hypothetical protein WC788_00325 [Candidatus Paceibacterota bacterium]
MNGNMKMAILNVQIETNMTSIRAGLAFNKNGKIELHFCDPADLGLDTEILSESSFPNSGSASGGKYSLWMSMFERYIKKGSNTDDL